MIDMIYIYVLHILAAAFGFRRLMFCLKFMQQDNYYNKRLMRFALKKLQLVDTHVFIPILASAICAEYIMDGIASRRADCSNRHRKESEKGINKTAEHDRARETDFLYRVRAVACGAACFAEFILLGCTGIALPYIFDACQFHSDSGREIN